MFSLFEKILGRGLDGSPALSTLPRGGPGSAVLPPEGLRCGAPTRR